MMKIILGVIYIYIYKIMTTVLRFAPPVEVFTQAEEVGAEEEEAGYGMARDGRGLVVVVPVAAVMRSEGTCKGAFVHVRHGMTWRKVEVTLG